VTPEGRTQPIRDEVVAEAPVPWDRIEVIPQRGDRGIVEVVAGTRGRVVRDGGDGGELVGVVVREVAGPREVGRGPWGRPGRRCSSSPGSPSRSRPTGAVILHPLDEGVDRLAPVVAFLAAVQDMAAGAVARDEQCVAVSVQRIESRTVGVQVDRRDRPSEQFALAGQESGMSRASGLARADRP